MQNDNANHLLKIPESGILNGINYGKNPDGTRTILDSLHQQNLANHYAVKIRFAKTPEEKLELIREHHGLVSNEVLSLLMNKTMNIEPAEIEHVVTAQYLQDILYGSQKYINPMAFVFTEANNVLNQENLVQIESTKNGYKTYTKEGYAEELERRRMEKNDVNVAPLSR